MLTNAQIRQKARQLLTRVTSKRYIFTVPLILMPIASILGGRESNGEGLAFFSLALQLLIGFFLVSAALTMLDIWRGEKIQATFTDSTRVFSRQLIGKLILVELLGIIYLLLPYLLVIGISLGLTFFSLGLKQPTMDWPIFVSVTLSILIGLAILLPIYYGFKQTTYVLYDQVKNGSYQNPHHVFVTSYRLMKGHRKQAFLLDLSFLGWWLLAIFTLGLSNIYSLPYYTSATAIFYDQLTQIEQKNY